MTGQDKQYIEILKLAYNCTEDELITALLLKIESYAEVHEIKGPAYSRKHFKEVRLTCLIIANRNENKTIEQAIEEYHKNKKAIEFFNFQTN